MCHISGHAWFDAWSDGPFTCEEVHQMLIGMLPEKQVPYHQCGQPHLLFSEHGCPSPTNISEDHA